MTLPDFDDTFVVNTGIDALAHQQFMDNVRLRKSELLPSVAEHARGTPQQKHWLPVHFGLHKMATAVHKNLLPFIHFVFLPTGFAQGLRVPEATDPVFLKSR